MIDPEVIKIEWLQAATIVFVAVAGALMSLTTVRPETRSQCAAFVAACVFLLLAAFTAAASLSYPIEVAGYETLQPDFVCVRMESK